MKIPKKITNFFEKEGIKHQIIEHKTVYTSFDKAATLRADLKLIGKSVIVKGDSNPYIVLIPGNKNLDKDKFQKVLSKVKKKPVKKVGFATERWIKDNFKGAKIGAIPPLGKLFKLPVFIERTLLKNKKIYISSGSYNYSLVVTPSAFKKTAEELFEGSFSKKRGV